MRTIIAIVAGGLAGVVWNGVRGDQVTQPSPGSGIVTIAGTVHVANTPSVKSEQLGEWKVAVANAPEVHVANTPAVSLVPPDFLRVRGIYDVIWSDGSREVLIVEEVRRGGWVRVTADRERWVNVTAARSVQLRQ